MKRLFVTLFIISALFLTGCPSESYNSIDDWPYDLEFNLGDLVNLKVGSGAMVIVACSKNTGSYKCTFVNTDGIHDYGYFSPHELELFIEDH